MNHTEVFNKIMKLNKPVKKAKIMPVRIQERENMNELQLSLSKCSIEGNVLYLPRPDEYTMTNYNDVRKALLNAGAAYKKNTFVFPNAAQPYIDRLMGGESVNIKKEFQFFGTPAKLADRLVELADIAQGYCILEPSAGQGAIIKAIRRQEQKLHSDILYNAPIHIDYCEIMDVNKAVLATIMQPNDFICDDFLMADEGLRYERIIANPPFNKNQDIDHIRKMYKLCADGGRIVTIASNSWRTGGQKKQVEFKKWLDEIGADIKEIPAGEFKESGTNVSACIIIINK